MKKKNDSVCLASLSPKSRAVLDEICVMASGFRSDELVQQDGLSAVQSFADLSVKFANSVKKID